VTETNSRILLDRYQRLAEISLDLASTLDLQVLLNRIVHIAAELSNAEAASILLYDEGKQQMYFEAASNMAEPLMRGLIVPVDSSIAGWVATNSQPLIISEAQDDPRLFKSIGKATNITTKSMLAIPLITKGKVVGVLESINRLAGEFTQDDLDVLMTLGAQAAIAIENARLFQQSDLISEMVHELRTPLASLSTAAHLLLRSDIPAEQRSRMAQVIYNETARLLEMANSFLDLARLESGRVQFRAQVFDVRMLLDECASVVRSKAVEQGLSLQISTPGKLPPLKADRDKLKQVILNLMSNSIKYNRPSGSITIVAEGGENNMVIAVSDTGVGIRPEDQAHLFEKFYRVKSSEGTTGTGLGLAICKRIVEAHAGSIECESQMGVGTTFIVTLPLR
jgi:signal transduction histidine kinase